jgi:hypothetical protein
VNFVVDASATVRSLRASSRRSWISAAQAFTGGARWMQV